MGNHCIDCEFCGQDRRLFGTYCCETSKNEEERKNAERQAKRQVEVEFLARFGLSVYDGRVYASDVVALLQKVENQVLMPTAPEVQRKQ